MSTLSKTILTALAVLMTASLALAQGGAPVGDILDATEANPNDWPRVIEHNSNRVVLHQPQIDRWDNYESLSASLAVSVLLKDRETPEIGSIRLTAKTTVDHATRSVLLGRRDIAGALFPETDPETYQLIKKAIDDALPNEKPLVMSLDEIVAYLDLGAQAVREVQANLDPPPILFSETPAVLVMFFGEAKFERVGESNDLLFAVNTNWDIFLNLPTSQYFLLNGDSWLTTGDLNTGIWSAAASLPARLVSLPDDPNWQEVRQRIPGKPATFVPTIFVATEPTELIVTDGPAQFTPIQETRLLHVSNAESDLFLYSGDGQFYLLTAGRWFRAEKLAGPWSAATRDLPEEFRKIPADHEMAHVLASVPDTSEAKAAVILASVPRKATIVISEATVDVVYEGDPEFVVIESADGVSYAVNSPNDVFLVENRYYCCYQGVWFISPQPAGRWIVCTSVPRQIYTIPATSPKYNVTYVHVVSSTHETVVVSQTAGYQGQVVVAGLLMFGLGYAIADDHHHHSHWHYHYGPHYYSYGTAARYDYYRGGYYRSAHVYGPYGGAGRAASYNARTGTYSRGAYRYGPRGAVTARDAYNPYTNRYAGRVSAATPYGSWGRTVVTDGNDWARAGHRSTGRGTVVGADNSDGGKIVAGRGRDGRGVVAKNKDGDVYVGKDGKVFRRDANGSWQGRNNNDWKKIDAASAERRKSELNRQRESRERGTARSREYQKTRARGQSRSGRSRSGGGARRSGGRGRGR